MLQVEDTDYFKDQQAITFDSSVNLLQNHVVAVRNIGSYSTPSSTDVSNTSIEIADEGNCNFTRDDFTSNVTMYSIYTYPQDTQPQQMMHTELHTYLFEHKPTRQVLVIFIVRMTLETLVMK